MRVTINVTQADIEAGTRQDCKACPVALAVKRLLVGGCSVNVSRLLEFEGHGLAVETNYPDTCADFINDFDQGKPVLPCTFEAEIPDNLLREGAA